MVFARSLAVALTAVVASQQASVALAGPLIGMTSSLDGKNFLAHLDPASGQYTKLVEVDRWNFLDAVFDSKSGKYIALGPGPNGDTGFVTYNASTGTILSFLELKTPFSSDNVPSNLQLDVNTLDIYGISLADNNDDPGEGSAGVYRISATTGATTLAATLPLKHVWSLVEGLSAYDPVTKTYIFWGTDETSNPTQNVMFVADCSAGAQDAVPVIKVVHTPWGADDLNFGVWDPSGQGVLLGYNSSSNTFVHVAEASGAVKSLGPVTVLPGIASEEAAVLSVAESQLWMVFVNPSLNPSRYEVATADTTTYNITSIVATQNNMDFAFLFELQHGM